MSAKESTHAGAQGAVAPAHTLTLTETPDAGLSKKEAKERHEWAGTPRQCLNVSPNCG